MSVTRWRSHPAAVYAIRKWDEWLRLQALRHMTSIKPPAPNQGIAQQTSIFTASMVAPKSEGNNTVDDSTHYGEWLRVHVTAGRKLSYQDAGSRTIMKSTPECAVQKWPMRKFVTSKYYGCEKIHGPLFVSQPNHESIDRTHQAGARSVNDS